MFLGNESLRPFPSDVNSIVTNTTQYCKQGVVLSPLMRSMVVNELLGDLTNTGIQAPGYADDIVVICRGKTGLRITSAWVRKAGLCINPVEANVVPFTWKCMPKHLRAIKLHVTEVRRVTKVNYLEITLDQKLQWRAHMTESHNGFDDLQAFGREKIGMHSKKTIQDIAIASPMITFRAVTCTGTTAKTGLPMYQCGNDILNGISRGSSGFISLHMHIQMQV